MSAPLYLNPGHNSLSNRECARWSVAASAAGEGVVQRRRSRSRDKRRRVDGGSPTSSEEKALRNARRRKGQIRRYIVFNRLRFMWTLTFAHPVYDHGAAMAAGAWFVKNRLRQLYEGPVLVVLEPHPGGHGWHLHLFVARRIDPHEEVQVAWGHGIANVKDWLRDRRLRRVPGRRRLRAAARYAAKYGGKSGMEELAKRGCAMEPGEHAYEVAQGYQPPTTMIFAETEEEALQLAKHFGPIDRLVPMSEDVGGGYWFSFEPRDGP